MPLPSVVLHDHLDGGLRVGTIIDLADPLGYDGLPSDDPETLADWFDQTDSGSLEDYLDAFEHTIAVMQDEVSLERVAYEAAVDLAADGVVYAEIRFGPNHHIHRGLSAERVVESVAAGMRAGEAETGLKWSLIVDALRQFDDSLEQARLAARMRSAGVSGFDLAGPEEAFPPTMHLQAFRFAREAGLRVTAHAGEAARHRGVEYMAAAMDVCGAERLGHGVEIIHDCVMEDGEIVKLGRVAARIRDRQVPLEMCPRSNLATSGWKPHEHPIGALYRAGFNVTISTDNRLMSRTSMSAEFDLVTEHHGFTLSDLALTTRRSLSAAFCDHETKVELWEGTIAPAYLAAGAELSTRWIGA